MEGPLLSMRIRESGWLAGVQVLLHALAVAASAFVDLPAWVLAAIMIACGASLAQIRWFARKSRQGGGVLLEYRSGTWWLEGQPAILDPASSVQPGMMILRLSMAASRQVLRILADSADPEARRRLRVLLRHGASTVSSARSDISG